MNIRGYQSPAFGKSFSQLGKIITLPATSLQVIKRPITEEYFDVVGPYPFAACQDWSGLAEDMAHLRDMGSVSMVLVVDPFAADKALNWVSDWYVNKPYKTQFIVDLHQNWRDQRTKNTRYYTRKALSLQTVDIVASGSQHTELFWNLYFSTIKRHSVTGIQRMSKETIRRQLEVPGGMLAIASRNNEPCGSLLYFNQGSTAHFHLMGLSTAAHKLWSSYALLYTALESLEQEKCHLVNLGGPTGLHDDPNDSLYNFKRRWTNNTMNSLLCGQVLSPTAYELLCVRAGSYTQPDFFPAYRAPGSKFDWKPVVDS